MDKIKTGFFEVNGGKLYFETAGEAPPLVLIHGGLMDCRMWDGQMQYFSQYFQVIRYDIRGYGRSDSTVERFSHIEDLLTLFDFLKIEKAHILGLSMGGMIAIDFVLEYPQKAASIIPVASSLNGYLYKDAENLIQKYTDIVKTVKDKNLDKAAELVLEMPYFAPITRDQSMTDKLMDMIKHNLNSWSLPQENVIWPQPLSILRLAAIKIPTLVLAGDADVSDILGVADVLANKIPGAKKVMIPGAGHHLNLENPVAFNEIVLDFLTTL